MTHFVAGKHCSATKNLQKRFDNNIKIEYITLMNIKFQVNTHGSPEAKRKLCEHFRKYIVDKKIYHTCNYDLKTFGWLQFTISNESTDANNITHYNTEWQPDEYQPVSMVWALEKMAEINFTGTDGRAARQSIYAYQVECKTVGQLGALLKYYLALGWADDNMDYILQQKGLTFDEYVQWYFERYPYFIIYSPYHGKTLGGHNNWTGGDYVQVAFEKAFALEFNPEVKPVDVPLNKDYTATVKTDGDVVVGCQLFSSGVIIKLSNEVKTMLDLKNKKNKM